jgi:hypothetical protein
LRFQKELRQPKQRCFYGFVGECIVVVIVIVIVAKGVPAIRARHLVKQKMDCEMGGIAQERIRCVTEKPRQPVLRLCMYSMYVQSCAYGYVKGRSDNLGVAGK